MNIENKQKKINVGAIVQARIGSTRLPGKVLLDIGGKPVIGRVFERLKISQRLNEIILAIPNTKENDVLEKFALENNVNLFRGSEEDVLARYYGAAEKFGLDIVVRITSDCPIIDPGIVDLIIKKHLDSKADYTSNILKRTFPRGLDVEVFDFDVLRKAYEKAKESYQREHVTPYIYENPKFFKLDNFEAPKEMRHPEFRLTLDTKEDYELIKEIFYRLESKKKNFSVKDVIDLIKENPALLKINAHIKQKQLK
jgi:spore coat polysaccharide biosynthesis protein SpsF